MSSCVGLNIILLRKEKNIYNQEIHLTYVYLRVDNNKKDSQNSRQFDM